MIGNRRRMRFGKPWLYRAASYEQLLQAARPLHWWKLNEVSGVTALDYGTGSALNLTHTNGPVVNQNPIAVDGRAVSYDGVNDHSSVSTAAITAPPFSVEMLFRATAVATGTVQTLLKVGNSVNTGFRIVLNGASTTLAYIQDGSGITSGVHGTTMLAATNYHMVLTTSAAGVANFYVNFALTSLSGLGTFQTPASLTRLGLWSDGSRPFGGTLQHVAIFDRVLSDSEISQRFYATGG